MNDIVLRGTRNYPLSHAEMDGNWRGLKSDLDTKSTSAELDGAVTQETMQRQQAIADTIALLRGAVPGEADSLGKLFNIIQSMQLIVASNDQALNTVQEIVNKIKATDLAVAGLVSTKVNITDIVNTLTSTATDKPLSAAQGKVLLDAVTLLQGLNSGDETAESIRAKLGITVLSGSNTGDETGVTIRSKLGVTSLSGVNTGDETAATIRTKLGVTTLSGSNTGDETLATIKAKLGITILSGDNTGDQTLASLGIPNVENKSSAEIRSEMTANDVTSALAFVPIDAAIRNQPNGVAGLNTSAQLLTAQIPAFTGDVTSLGSSTGLTLANTAVTPSSYGSATQVPTFTVDSKGRLVAANMVTITPAWSNVTNKPTTIAGFGILDALTLGNVPGTALGTAAAAGTATTAARSDHAHAMPNLDLLANMLISGKAPGDSLVWNGSKWVNTPQSGITSGNATKLETARQIALSGDASGSANFDGSANITIAATLANTGVPAGGVGDDTGRQVPYFTVDAKGRITAAGTMPVAASWFNVFNKPTTVDGYGITNAVTTDKLGAANGVATLGADGRLVGAQIPAALVGALVYQSGWNASTNVPALTSGVGTKGHYYKVSVAGPTNLDGQNFWLVGDLAVYNGATWDRFEGDSTEVTSVAGRVGPVVLTSADIGGLAASATTDTTNASNIGSGTLAVTRLPAMTGGDVTSVAGSGALVLGNSGAAAGSYGGIASTIVLTVNAKGQITAISQVPIAAAWSLVSDKPAFGTASLKDIPATGNASATQVVYGTDTRLSDARAASDVYAWAKAAVKPSYVKADVGLGSVDNTSDLNKPVSTAQAAADTAIGSTAATDATTKANAAVATAAADATTKANAAQAAAIAASAPSTHVGTGGAAHAVATISVHGFMSSTDKSKLDGIAAGATNYAHPANHPPSIITQDANNRFVTDADKVNWNSKQAALGYTPIPVTWMGVASGVAELDSGIRLKASQAPSNMATTGANTFNGSQSQTRSDLGAVGSGTATFNAAANNVQKLTVAGSLSIAFINWAAAGTFRDVLVELVNGGVGAITFPASVRWILPTTGAPAASFAAYLTAIGRNPAALQSSGTDFLYFWSSDGGANVYAKLM